MTKLYFSYRKKENPQNTGNFYTPSFDFVTMYPEMEGIASMRDELLQPFEYVMLPNGKTSWVNVGILEVDESLLSSFGKDLEYIKGELLSVGWIYAMKIEDEASLREFLQVYTTKSFEDLWQLTVVDPAG